MKKVIGSVAVVLALASVTIPAQAQFLSLGGLLKVRMIQGGGINLALLNGNVNVNLFSNSTSTGQ
jgi:hypothetical protein